MREETKEIINNNVRCRVTLCSNGDILLSVFSPVPHRIVMWPLKKERGEYVRGMRLERTIGMADAIEYRFSRD